MTDHEVHRGQKEAAGSTIRHRGPTATRYATALERYLGVVAGEPPVAVAAPHFRWAAPRTVADVMTRAITTVPAAAPVRAVVEALERNRGCAVPVVDDAGRVLGVVTTSDVLTRVAGTVAHPRGHGVAGRAETRRKQRGRTAAELMTAPAITTTTVTSVPDAARLAARQRVRSLPVLDHRGELAGMVSRDDLVKVFLRADADIQRDVEANVALGIDQAGQSRAGNAVDVTVADGIVTITGQVATARLAESLIDRARRIVGVVGVNDLLEFRTNDAFPQIAPP